MPAIDIESPEQYRKAWDVLIQVGGTFHGVGQDKRTLLVTNTQYEALVAAGVVKDNGTKDRRRGKKKTNRHRKVEGASGDSED